MAERNASLTITVASGSLIGEDLVEVLTALGQRIVSGGPFEAAVTELPWSD